MLGHSADCSSLKEAMVVVENQILKSRLPQCNEQRKNFCCRADEPDSCLTNREVNSRYNDIMAKLIIYEGILALGQSINDNHKLIKHMGLKRIQESKQHIAEFFESMNKSELIHNSLQLNGDTGLWTEYSGSSSSEMETYLNQACASGNDYKSFCESYNRIMSQDKEKKFDYLESLHGFATADQMVLDNNRRADYENYKEYLTLTIDGEEISYSEAQNHPEVKNLMRLKQKLNDLPASSGDEVPKEILALTKKLNKVSVKYNAGVNVRSRFKEFISEDIEQNIAKYNQSTQLLLGVQDFKSNIDDFHKSFVKQQDSNLVSLKKDLVQYYGDNDSARTALGCDNFVEGGAIQCIKNACRPLSTMEGCENNDPKVNEYYKQILAVEKLDETKEMLESTKVCLDKENLDEQQACIISMKADLFEIADDKIEELRKELAHVEKIRLTMNQGEPFENLNHKKLMAAYAYKKMGCIKKEDHLILNNYHSSCGVPEVAGLDNSLITLKDDVDDVVINLSDSASLNSNLSFDDNLMRAYREDLIAQCNNPTDNATASADAILCEHYKAVQREEEETRRSIASGSRSSSEIRSLVHNRPGVAPVPDAPKMSEGPTWEDGAVAVLGTGVSLLPAMIQYGNIKQNHELQMQNNVYALNNMYRQREYMNTLYENQSRMQFQNYGWNYYNPYNATGFGGNNTSSIYYSPLDYSQLSFASPQFISPTSNSFDFSPTSTSTSSTTTVGFGF
jgi:hypothetical protein